MTSNRAQSLYGRRARLYQTFFVRLLKWESVLADFFRSHPYLQSGMSILDAGCGTGSVTKTLVRLAELQKLTAITFHAFDLTPAMLEIFQDWLTEVQVQGVRLQQADVLRLDEQLSADWTGYDLIVSSAMFEYIPKEGLGRALTQLSRRLASSGRLLTFLTRRTRLTRWTGARWWGTNLFSPEEFTQILRQSGFAAVRLPSLPPKWNSFMMAVEAAAPHPKG
ncbi:MAG TPA: class I SAM-dependent methyltransferase [Anaerolineaceae bacterium]|nr:class I SAM-dependent methyltransferase [Anaerolineaceae bacterium]